MLIDFQEAIEEHGIAVSGVLHVGTHLAEEAPMYNHLGVPVLWVEANADLKDVILAAIKPYRQQLYPSFRAVTDVDDDLVMFHITNYDSMSSSIFDFGTHPTFSPDTIFVEHRLVNTVTIDTITQPFERSHQFRADTLVMDIQGAELLALKGATKFLKHVDTIYTEVNKAEVYVGCAQVEEIDTYLTDFERVQTHWVGEQGWGDALYLRKEKSCS